MALPFTLLPLLAITASKEWMSTEVLPSDSKRRIEAATAAPPSSSTVGPPAKQTPPAPSVPSEGGTKTSRRGSVDGKARKIQPGLLLKWSWWTRGAGKIIVAQQHSPQQQQEQQEEEQQSTCAVSPCPAGVEDNRTQRDESNTPIILGSAVPATPTSAPLLTPYGRAHFANSWPLVLITGAIYIVICISDVYVIVTTALGTGGV